MFKINTNRKLVSDWEFSHRNTTEDGLTIEFGFKLLKHFLRHLVR
ncbi:MAG: hypothetical protein JETCAE03_35830 [Ignavibacteriaceae bacterium]|jgi:hypothetical protein|nr:MAG: hypothetical protein JETCAE03_35830 [Ignavibacteriaceae bacterium]